MGSSVSGSKSGEFFFSFSFLSSPSPHEIALQTRPHKWQTTLSLAQPSTYKSPYQVNTETVFAQ